MKTVQPVPARASRRARRGMRANRRALRVAAWRSPSDGRIDSLIVHRGSQRSRTDVGLREAGFGSKVDSSHTHPSKKGVDHMPEFLKKASCRGRRPLHLVPRRQIHSPNLIAKLLRERYVARFIVAPDGSARRVLRQECRYGVLVRACGLARRPQPVLARSRSRRHSAHAFGGRPAAVPRRHRRCAAARS